MSPKIMKKNIVKIALCLMALSCPLLSQAQDVIVKTDGTTIISKVLEVTPDCIKYKKHSNQQGPTYTVNITDVMAINYENGEKDVFDNNQSNSAPKPTDGGYGVNPNLEEDNLKLVRQFNQRNVVCTKGTDKTANNLICVLGLKEGSILENPELKADFAMKRYVTHTNGKEAKMTDLDVKTGWGINRLYEEWMYLMVTLTNKTDKSIYVDLANCFLISDQSGAKPMYTPTVTGSTTSSTSGSSVSLGSVMGGVVGGIGVGASSTNMNTTTTYAQRIVIIPPKSTLSLPGQNIRKSYDATLYRNGRKIGLESDFLTCLAPVLMAQGLIEDDGRFYNVCFDKLKVGETIDVPMQQNAPLTVHLSYSFDESQTNHQSIRSDFYLRNLIGARDMGTGDRADFTDMDISQQPLLF